MYVCDMKIEAKLSREDNGKEKNTEVWRKRTQCTIYTCMKMPSCMTCRDNGYMQ